jgi:PKD repeat protein
MSAPVVMKASEAAPHAVLQLSRAGDLTVKASTAGSSDPDGRIAQSKIDFGDGTVISGPVATHHYAQVGAYTVTATVVDRVGASAVAATRVEARAAGPGVTILSPTESATVNWPTPIVVSVNSSRPIMRTNVLIDGNPAFTTDRGAINSLLKVFVGTHHISVQAIDASGAVSQASVDVVGEPGDLPPTAGLTVVPLPSVSPTTVLACFLGSRDPDGFILGFKSQFSDGAVFFTAAAVHTLAAPGAYSVTLNVIDQFGAPASTTENFTVNASAFEPLSGSAAQIKERRNKAVQRPFEPIRRP